MSNKGTKTRFEMGVKTLGFDYLSVNKFGGDDDVHEMPINNLTLFEGLDLSKVPEGEISVFRPATAHEYGWRACKSNPSRSSRGLKVIEFKEVPDYIKDTGEVNLLVRRTLKKRFVCRLLLNLLLSFSGQETRIAMPLEQ